MPPTPYHAPTPTKPLRVSELREGDRNELSRGHLVYCAPASGRHGGHHTLGALPLASDPAVTQVGVDVGYALADDTLRAPDISVGNVPSAPGYVQGAPPLAVEYADTGTNEVDLATKITELFTGGTQLVWVVRLKGLRRVEVHAPGVPMRTMLPGAVLTAPGILANPVPVEALFDREAALQATLRNLLQRQGYADLDAVLTQGRDEGRDEGLAPLLRFFARKLARPLTDAERTLLTSRLATLGAERLGDVALDLDGAQLAAWLEDADAR